MTEQPPSYPPPPPGGYGYQPPPRAVGTNGMAIASLVCSLFGWVCIIGSILGVFGFMALGQIKQSGQGGRGMAIAGIVIGVVMTAFVILVGAPGAISGRFSDTHSSAPAVAITVEQQPALAAVTT